MNQRFLRYSKKIHSDSFKVIGLKESGSDLAGSPEVFSKMVLDANAALADFDISIKKIEKAMSKYLRFHGDAT